jgi:hypothetical protein
MNLYNSKKLKTFKSKKLTLKGRTGGGRRQTKKKTNKTNKPNKPNKPNRQPTPSSKPQPKSALSTVSKPPVPGATSQGPASATQGLASGVSGTPSSLVTSALKSGQAARIARTASESAAAASAAASASAAAVSAILPSAALVYNHRFCNIKSKKLRKRIQISDNKPIFQEIVYDSKHILSSDPVIFKDLILFADKKYNEISIDTFTIAMLGKFNSILYTEIEMYVKAILNNKQVNPIGRANSTLPNNSNNIVSTKRSALEKITKARKDISKHHGKSNAGLNDYSDKLIKYTADIELITSANLMNMLAGTFFIYFNSSLDNSNCNKNDIAGIRIYDYIDIRNSKVNYYEKKISNLDLKNKQEIVLVDYENYNHRMEDIIKIIGYHNIRLNSRPFNICDICNVYPNKLFIFIRTLKYKFRLYELVQKDKDYNNLLYINVFGREYAGKYQNKIYNINGAPGSYKSIMTDDFLLIELYNFLTKKNFNVSIISRDKYDIISNKYYRRADPKFNIYKYDVDPTGYNVVEIKVRNFQFYENYSYEAIVRRLIANPITNKNNVPISINNLTNAVNAIVMLQGNSNYYHSFLLLIYILQNYAP